VTWIPLTGDPGGLNAYKQILPAPRRPIGQLETRVHEGHEWLYVINGTLRLVLGENEFTLKGGEAAEFDTRVPHAIVNAGRRSLELLIIFGPQGERVHLRTQLAAQPSVGTSD
jgi:mannose-6-phosphate isomerase-like protein (cupin superfamily)